jgi:hypothetical protein
MSIALALADAANLCARGEAKAAIVLRSGVRYKGQLSKDSHRSGSAHLRLEGGGWVTIDVGNIAAVEAMPV